MIFAIKKAKLTFEQFTKMIIRDNIISKKKVFINILYI